MSKVCPQCDGSSQQLIRLESGGYQVKICSFCSGKSIISDAQFDAFVAGLFEPEDFFRRPGGIREVVLQDE